MTVAHSTLTGTDLHEIKGASTATAGQVPVADGLGGAPFGKVGAAGLAASANPFGAQLLHIREEQASGVASSNGVPPATYTSQVLTSVKTNEISGASLASNVITLPAGTYYCEAMTTYRCNVGAGATGTAAIRLFDSTGATTLLYGPNAQVYQNLVMQGQLFVKGRFTLAAPHNLVLQQYVTQSATAIGFGGSNPEVYSDIAIWKVA